MIGKDIIPESKDIPQLTLSGEETYSAATEISEGTIMLGTAAALGAGSVIELVELDLAELDLSDLDLGAGLPDSCGDDLPRGGEEPGQ